MSERQKKFLDSLNKASTGMLEKDSSITVAEGMNYEITNNCVFFFPERALKDKLKYQSYDEENNILKNNTVIHFSISRNDFNNIFFNIVDGELEKMKCHEIFESIRNARVTVKVNSIAENSGPFESSEVNELDTWQLNDLIKKMRIKKQIFSMKQS